MSFNKEPLTVTQVSSILWKIEREITYHVGSPDSKDVIVVPKGFITDFASVPWPANMLIPLSGNHNMAAVVHDYLYCVQTRTRLESDKIFLEALTVLGVNWFKRQIMYRAVRIGGGRPWDIHTKKMAEHRNMKFIGMIITFFLLFSGCAYNSMNVIRVEGKGLDFNYGFIGIKNVSSVTFYRQTNAGTGQVQNNLKEITINKGDQNATEEKRKEETSVPTPVNLSNGTMPI